jgi:hypothetical protein
MVLTLPWVSDCLFIDPLATSTESHTLNETTMDDLEMHRWSTKRCKAKIPHPYEDLRQTPF